VFVLYRQDLLSLSVDEALARIEDDKVDPYIIEMVHGVAAKGTEIDQLLKEHISGWSVQRLGTLERAILRVAVFEMLWTQDVPTAVAIDEAVVLAKKYCSDEAGALVNGVLGSLAKDVSSD
jgi:N utilization substance protein B